MWLEIFGGDVRIYGLGPFIYNLRIKSPLINARESSA